jgi:hypothetical protein
MSSLLSVYPVPFEICKPFILERHYAKRVPPVSFAFGLYYDSNLVAVCTFGKPASNTLCEGVCGKQNASFVYELNRLCAVRSEKNWLSFFVAQCLRLLPEMIVVSFADTSQHHHGYIYQATNWIYTGLSAKRTDWKVKGKEHLHSFTIGDEFRGCPNRVEKLKKTYGQNFYLQERPRKHRYIYFVGSKTKRKHWMRDLQYEIQPYPKGDNKRYQTCPIYSQSKLF